jgi:hypothetical protein
MDNAFFSQLLSDLRLDVVYQGFAEDILIEPVVVEPESIITLGGQLLIEFCPAHIGKKKP